MIDAATLAQQRAADPAHSVWLSANAGSGKTKVLTDRVARLLLQGTQPQRILCLTYTKAAAAEMQNRLFVRLGEWAMMPEAKLRDALGALGLESDPSADVLAEARRLFARAIETPGGLKIQTIHSFCAGLLRRFPLEAGVSPGFTEMDDRVAELMRAEIVEDMAERLAPDAVAALAALHTAETFGKLVEAVSRWRAGFTPAARAHLGAALGVAPGDTTGRLLADTFLGGEANWLPQVGAIMAAGKSTDKTAAERLAALDLGNPTLETLAALEGILLFGVSKIEGKSFTAKTGVLPTKDMQPVLGDLLHRLNDLMLRVEAGRKRRLALSAYQRSLALHDFAAVFLPEYDRRKQARGWLDFDDLVLRARALVSDPSVAQWVLYRLDGGIDHILVDEAQDTGPEQWQVIDSLTREITAGQGARDLARTIFVVGDKKQSIYSFQGADLDKFDAMQAHFGAALAAMGKGLRCLPLDTSFRSSPAILRAVDMTCAAFPSLGQVSHVAFRAEMPGRVDLWPALPPEKDPEPEDWSDPVDMPVPRAPSVLLADAIATEIRGLVLSETVIPTPKGDRRLTPGDVLVLVQRRSDAFHEIIRACKQAGLPIAGADRLKLGGEIAVKDLAALLSFLATPEDDLSLAHALRSPLFGWTEAQLYDMAQGRKGWLWEVLRNCGDHAETLAILHDLRNQSDYLRPYELLQRMLIRHDGRRRLIARLGAEAEDGIDQFLGQALAYERLDVPSLTGFLTWLQTDDIEVKRQSDSAGGRIRVMTVHGAKGLEAPLVILADCADRRVPDGASILPVGSDLPAWKPSAGDMPAALAAARADEQRRWAEENQRLLYVAMTRAESWLIVAAAGATKSEHGWHNLVSEGLAQAGAVPFDTPLGAGLRLAYGTWPQTAAAAEAGSRDDTPRLPAWARDAAPAMPRPARALSPSDLGGAKALAGDLGLPETEAKARGTALHRLLEVLPAHPAANWPAIAAALPGCGDPALLAEARRVLEAPELGWLFEAGTLAEVEVVATLDQRQMIGTVDRLVFTPDKVLAVDFKSNADVPARPEDVPEGLLRQMGAYAEALRQIWPGRRIEVALLWTSTATLMPLPQYLVSEALARATLP